LVGWVRERDDDPRDVRVPEPVPRAREFEDLVLVAMDRRYPRESSVPGSDAHQ
jgi:hypothetical protein